MRQLCPLAVFIFPVLNIVLSVKTLGQILFLFICWLAGIETFQQQSAASCFVFVKVTVFGQANYKNKRITRVSRRDKP